ncbi:MAG: glycoside hydrolase N-terminal domain-containing protein, partial [Fulvivirga sp.]|uniref:glycoside hydrolase N-terminal domain-containing protein n=1 Tax=Fulvivirga sp. TaxID=1931237 RepID=UPI0032EB08C0
MKSVLKIFTATLLCHIYITTYSIGIDVNSGDLIWSNKQTNTWSEGYPIGNGRIGGMVLGNAKKERIALNHDLLWRNFWDYQNHNTASDMPEIISASLNGEWDILEEKVLAKVSRTGKAIYVNPYVPVGDLFIDMDHSSTVTAYQRTLNMQEGIVEISYDIGEVSYKREVFVSWEQGIMVIRLSSNRMGMLSGEVSLSRLLDPECKLRGYSELDKLVMEGEFEEGRKFSFAAKVIQRGGRLTGGNRKYEQPFGDGSEKDLGLSYIFNQQNETTEKGPSTYFDSSNEVLILIAINVDQEFDSNDKLAEQSINKLNSINTNYDLLMSVLIANHQRFYNRVRIDLSKTDSNISTDSLLKYSIKNNTASPELIEKMFNMSRYLAISSGTPQKNSTNKAPINLQ